MLIQNNDPGAGFVSWSGVQVKYKGVTYTIADGNSDKLYIWWDFSTPTAFQESDTMPTMTDNDFIAILNDSGTYYLVGLRSRQVHGEMILDGTVPIDKLTSTPYIDGQFIFTVPGVLASGNNKTPELFAADDLTISEVFISCKTGPVGSDLICDINKNGTTIFTTQGNRPTITDGNTSGTSGTPDVTALAKNDKLTLDIDQVGSGTPGSDITVHVRFSRDVN
jgi:hypothetical protein